MPEESPKTSKVADGKQCPELGMLQQPLLRAKAGVRGRGFEEKAVLCCVVRLCPLMVSFFWKDFCGLGAVAETEFL